MALPIELINLEAEVRKVTKLARHPEDAYSLHFGYWPVDFEGRPTWKLSSSRILSLAVSYLLWFIKAN